MGSEQDGFLSTEHDTTWHPTSDEQEFGVSAHGPEAEEFLAGPESMEGEKFETWLRLTNPVGKEAYLAKKLEEMADEEPDTVQTRRQILAEAGARFLLLDSVPEAPPPIGPQAIVDIKPEDHWNNVRGARIHPIDDQETEPRGEQ
jgi:hypothetical protein